MYHEHPLHFLRMLFKAIKHPLLGLHPYELSLNIGSKIISNKKRIPSCTILSLGDGIVKGLNFLLGFGIYTLRAH